MNWVLPLKRLILPPAGPLLVGCTGLILHAADIATGLAFWLVALGLVSLYLLSVPVFVAPWLHAVDRYPRFNPDNPPASPPQAIVILDGGKLSVPPERGGETVTARTLERLDEGARLHRRTGLPVLVTGYGDLMARTLEDSFGITAGWAENRSRNTQENARYSAEILRQEHIDRVFVVTHFWHMRRSLTAFRQAGFQAVPVPAGRATRQPSERGLLALVPQARSLSDSYLLLHEAIGRIWYRVRYGIRDPDRTKRSTLLR